MQADSAVHRNQCHDQDRRSDDQDLAQVVLQPEGAGRLFGCLRLRLRLRGGLARHRRPVGIQGLPIFLELVLSRLDLIAAHKVRIPAIEEVAFHGGSGQSGSPVDLRAVQSSDAVDAFKT